MSVPKKGDLSSSEKELFEVISAGKPLLLIPEDTAQASSLFFLACMINYTINNTGSTVSAILKLLDDGLCLVKSNS